MLLSGPADAQRVDFLRADVAGEHRGAIGRDIDLSTELCPIHHSAKIFQAGDGLYLAVGESQALSRRFRASGRKVEILVIQRGIPVHEVACDKVAPFFCLEVKDPEMLLVLRCGYQSVLGDPHSSFHSLGGRHNGYLPGALVENLQPSRRQLHHWAN